MDSGHRPFIGIGFIVLACLGPGVHSSEAQQIRIEGMFPRQVPRGQATLISVALPSQAAIQAAEIAPAAGVKISGITPGKAIQGALTWSELTIEVAADAAPGDRTLVLVMPMGRTAPVTITIPSHVPSISELRVLPAQAKPPTLDLQFAVVDAAADLGDSPYVWFTIGCGNERRPGVVFGKVAAGDKGSVVRASVPTPPTPAGGRTPASSRCDVQVRMTDSGGIESNTLRTTVDFKN